MPQSKNTKRKAARGIVIHEGKILLLERWRKDDGGNMLHYFSVPGGKIETKETPEVTVVRELFEETSLLVRTNKLLAKQLFKDGSSNLYFLCDYLSGGKQPHSGPSETQTATNHTKPRWLSLAELKDLPLNDIYEPVRKLIIAALQNNLPAEPLQIK